MVNPVEVRKKVLVIEDDKDVRKVVSFRLRKLGLDVLTATNGEHGLRECRKENPDLIILDLYLPILSGEEICKIIREGDCESLGKIPIIMLTGKNSEADRIVGKSIGANFYLTKPFDPDELLRDVQACL